MKKLAMALMSLMALVFCAACSSAIDDMESVSGSTTQKQEHKVRTQLNFTGEILKIKESPLSRGEETAAKDWYAIQVYQMDSTNNGTMDGHIIYGYTYTPYAYGLFDDVSNLELDLVEGKTYKIEAVMIKEASDSIYKISTGGGRYLYEPTNAFKVTPNVCFSSYSLASEFHFYKDNVSYDHYLEEFYGCTTGYTPKEGSSANISMKRASFGVKLKANDFTEGTITARIGGSPNITMTPEQTEVQKIISFRHDLSGEQETNLVTIVWTKPDGTQLTLGSKNITFKRNTLTTIEFSAKAPTISQKLNAITVVSEEWQVGETIVIN